MKKNSVNFYCPFCELFFDVPDKSLIDEVCCPKCKTFNVFLEITLAEAPNYYT